MADLHYTPQALDDLDAIWQYTLETWGAAQAVAYVERLEQRCKTIAEDEALPVKSVATKAGKCLMVRHDHHRIFFYRNGTMVVLAILHESMDLIHRLEARL